MGGAVVLKEERGFLLFAYRGTSAFRSSPASHPGTGLSAADPASPTAPWWGEAQAAGGGTDGHTEGFPSVPRSGLLKNPLWGRATP